MAKKQDKKKGGKLAKRGKTDLKNSKARTKKIEARDRQDKLLQLYASGKALDSIALDEGLDMRVVVNAVSTALDRQVKNYAEPSPQHQFVRYAVFNMDLIKKLDDARKMFMFDPEGKQYSMIISSIRAQHDIFDKIQDKGMTLGVIKKRKADNKSLSGGKRAALRELQKEATMLLEIVDEFDPHTQFKRRRRINAKITAREQTTEVEQVTDRDENGRPFACMIRKVMRRHGIVVRALPDKFLRKRIFNSDGSEKPKRDWTLQDYERADVEPPKQLTAPKAIDAEFEELTSELETERAKAS